MSGGILLPNERQVQRAIPLLSRGERLRFLRAKFDIPCRFTDCWLWSAPASTGRYGLFELRGDKFLPHRVMWSLVWGVIPTGMNVLHRCDTPRCVNPNHLFLGTHADNMRDMAEKGRGGRRDRIACISGATLSPEDISAIRLDPRFQKVIAANYGVNQSTISDIKRGVTWAHL